MKLDLSFNPVAKQTDLQELLAKVDKLLKGEHVRPIRSFNWFEVLIPKDFIFKPITIHFYNELPPVGLEVPDNASVVVHGHSDTIPCYAPHYCHVLGYSPTGAEHPSFIGQFNMKWSNK